MIMRQLKNDSLSFGRNILMAELTQSWLMRVLRGLSFRLTYTELKLINTLGQLGSQKKRYRGVESMLLLLSKTVKRLLLVVRLLVLAMQQRESDQVEKKWRKFKNSLR